MSRTVKRIIVIILCIILVLVLLLGGYVLYLSIQYSRIADGEALAVQNPQAEQLATGTEYTALTYNIGFGAYDHAYSFFMDSGVMEDGTQVKGKYGRAASEEVVRRNTEGAIGTAAAQNADFYLFQEVDTEATRSFGINQSAEIGAAFPDHSNVFASNFHSAYLMLPLANPIGSVNSGVLTLADKDIDEAVRRSLPVDESFPTKFFDLDRCFALLRIPVEEGRELVLLNVHMSAFDEGGTVRAQQLEMLGEVMAAEYQKGNWVVAGGDFNHAFYGSEQMFPGQQQVPEWVHTMTNDDLPAGFAIVRAGNIETVPTCRSSDIPYEAGVNFCAVLDGFIVSDNIEASATNMDADFEYSDHNPVLLEFSLQNKG